MQALLANERQAGQMLLHKIDSWLNNRTEFLELLKEIARHVCSGKRKKANQKQNKKYALELQTVVLPDTRLLHAGWPNKGRRHDWVKFVAREIEKQIYDVLTVNKVLHAVSGDSGHIRPLSNDVPFQSSQLPLTPTVANKITTTTRVTIKWSYQVVKRWYSTNYSKHKLIAWDRGANIVYTKAMTL